MREPVIRELIPKLLEDYLEFFDHDAFADNPDWAGCYCMYHHFSGTDEEWFARTASENRAAISDLAAYEMKNGKVREIPVEIVGPSG